MFQSLLRSLVCRVVLWPAFACSAGIGWIPFPRSPCSIDIFGLVPFLFLFLAIRIVVFCPGVFLCTLIKDAQNCTVRVRNIRSLAMFLSFDTLSMVWRCRPLGSSSTCWFSRGSLMFCWLPQRLLRLFPAQVLDRCAWSVLVVSMLHLLLFL